MRLAEFRQKAGLSQAQLADMIGANQSTIARAESMDKTAKLATYQRCADALGVTIYDIFSTAPREGIEQALMDAFRGLDDASKDHWLALLRIAQGVEPLKSDPEGQGSGDLSAL